MFGVCIGRWRSTRNRRHENTTERQEDSVQTVEHPHSSQDRPEWGGRRAAALFYCGNLSAYPDSPEFLGERWNLCEFGLRFLHCHFQKLYDTICTESTGTHAPCFLNRINESAVRCVIR